MPAISRPALAEARAALRADCGRCAALCCVAPVFVASADFAIDKGAGRPCPNLGSDDRCTIHAGLREGGFTGCAVFDCFGAGQHVAHVTFGRRHWRDDPTLAASMFTVFGVVRQLKELSWYLVEALMRLPDDSLRADVQSAYERNEHLMSGTPHELAGIDAAARRRLVGPLLARASAALRADVPRRCPDRIGADLINARLRGTSFAGASLRGAYLLGADLRGADLRRTDLLGADLRAADLRGAALRDSLFLTQPQLDAALGDHATTIPRALSRPRHWPAG